ncbi:MAG: ABC transporter permease [Candidatus Microsaccharimonas sp.]
MIRFFDAVVLARTKLRSHRIRTGLTVGISGLLFGVIILTIVVMQGIFDSVNRFSHIGLNDRSILQISHSNMKMYNPYDHLNDAAFINEIEIENAAIIAKKTAAAKKYSITYVPASDDPSPIGIDPVTKQKTVTDNGLASAAVNTVVNRHQAALNDEFSIDKFVSPYKSSKVLEDFAPVQPANGALVFMKNGKEVQTAIESKTKIPEQFDQTPSLTLLDQTVADPFINDSAFDPSKGEVPVILPISAAEKLLDLKPLPKTASLADQRARLTYIREHIGEATTSFCYRNYASSTLLARAIAQQDELKQTGSSKDYVKPSVTYTLPKDTECGAITIASDTRSAAEKKAEANQILYEKEINTWAGEPYQRKIVVRGVGISADISIGGSSWSVGTLVQGMLSSSLGYNTWSVPRGLLQELPESARPTDLFAPADTNNPSAFYGSMYLVEFGDQTEARAVLAKTGMFGQSTDGTTYAYPFGSGVLLVNEARKWAEGILFWALIAVGGIAAIILAAIIGRTVADGRRESAVFRAIGAKRSDIVTIYGTYTLLLSLRVVVFAAIMGIGFGIAVELLFSDDATLGAQLAYASADTNIRFHLFGIFTWYLLATAGFIIVIGAIASIIPILLGARRNPIKDMRDDS